MTVAKCYVRPALRSNDKQLATGNTFACYSDPDEYMYQEDPAHTSSNILEDQQVQALLADPTLSDVDCA